MNYVMLIQVFLLLLFPSITSGQEQILNIVYTGGMHGELEPCGCSPKVNFGGVARISGYLAQHKRELCPYILIESGNFTDRATAQGRLKAEAFLRAFNIMRYDAVALLKNERAFPEDFFLPIIKKYSIPVISDLSQYNKSISVKRKNIIVNVSIDPKNIREDAINILLTDRSISELKSVNGWDVIINSSGEIIEEPLKINTTIIVAGYPEGKRLGILTIFIDSYGHIRDFKHRWQPLGDDIPEDMRVRSILADYDSKVAMLLREADRPATETTYVGVSGCAECHQIFVESWQKTRHARAFSSLEHVGKSADPECLPCHTVGFGEEGGFYTIETTPELANVQCEACHGLDREHLEDFSRPMQPVTESVCQKCHTKDKSPDFDYPVYLEKVKH
jgi:hypothetical protein